MDYQDVSVPVVGRGSPGRRLAHGSDPWNAEQFQQWPRRDSNPHGGYPPRDFKSRASANSATRPGVPGR